MDLKTFISLMPGEKRDEFAQRCLTTKGHIQNVMYGMKPCGTALAVLIERESGREVTRQELRDDWANHWPELIKSGSEGWDGITERHVGPADRRISKAA